MLLGFHSLVSYNCRGWNSGRTLINDFIDDFDLCFVQEHWLLNSQLDCLTLSPQFCSTGVSGMDDVLLPISATLNLICSPSTMPESASHSSTCHHTNWDLVTEEHIEVFRTLLASTLPELPDEVVSCADPFCESHLGAITDFRAVFLESCSLAFSTVGLNNLYGTKYRKAYSESDKVCANVLRGFLSAGGLRFDVESRRSETEQML